MDACYSHIAITYPNPGGFSRNGVEKVWLLRSFLATLGCVDAVTRRSSGYAAAATMQWRLMVKGHRIQLKISSSRDGPWDAIRNFVARRLLRLRHQLIAYSAVDASARDSRFAAPVLDPIDAQAERHRSLTPQAGSTGSLPSLTELDVRIRISLR